MNANELLPQLKELQAEVVKLIEKNNQQQAEIERFKQLQDYLYKTHDADKAEIEALKRGNEATALLNYNKGHEDGRKLATPSPADKGVLFTEYNEEVSKKLWLDLGKASEK